MDFARSPSLRGRIELTPISGADDNDDDDDDDINLRPRDLPKGIRTC